MKKYLVIIFTKGFVYRIPVRSIKLAKWIVNLMNWKYAKIHDRESKCIYIMKEGRVRFDES